MKPILNLSLADLKLSPGGPGVMLGDLNIAGIPMHVMLIEVTERNGVFTEGDSQHMIDGVADADGGTAYHSVSYEGKPYFIVIHPHQA